MLVAIRRVHSNVVAMLFIYTNCVLELRGQQRTSRIAAGENCASTYGRICDAFFLDYHLSVLDNPVGDVCEIVQIDNCKSAYPGEATGSKSNFRKSSGYSLVPISSPFSMHHSNGHEGIASETGCETSDLSSLDGTLNDSGFIRFAMTCRNVLSGSRAGW